jgi:hypothetical protein
VARSGEGRGEGRVDSATHLTTKPPMPSTTSHLLGPASGRGPSALTTSASSSGPLCRFGRGVVFGAVDNYPAWTRCELRGGSARDHFLCEAPVCNKLNEMQQKGSSMWSMSSESTPLQKLVDPGWPGFRTPHSDFHVRLSRSRPELSHSSRTWPTERSETALAPGRGRACHSTAGTHLRVLNNSCGRVRGWPWARLSSTAGTHLRALNNSCGRVRGWERNDG